MKDYCCSDCFQAFRVEMASHISPSSALLKVCPFCGSENVKCVDWNVDRYWYDLSESLGFGRSAKGSEFTQGLYKLWEPAEYKRFRDFIESIRDQLGVPT